MLNYIPVAQQVTFLDKHSNSKTALILNLISTIKHIVSIEPIVDLNDDRVYYEITLDNDQIAEVYHDFNIYKMDTVNFILFQEEFYYNVQEILKAYD